MLNYGNMIDSCRPLKKSQHIFIWLSAWALYLKMVAPLINLGDTPELIAAGKIFGVAHPTGYPLFTFLLKIFSFFPLGNIAYRCNLFSTICGCTAILFVFWFSRLLVSQLSAIIITLFWILSLTFQSQSLFARVYVLNLLLTLMVLYLGALSLKKPRYYILSFFLYGIGLANHFVFLNLFLPLYLLF